MALLRTGRRGCRWCSGLLAHNAEHWLSDAAQRYLRDDDEYRAITRQTIIRGTAGIIAFAPETVTVTSKCRSLVARALRHRPGQRCPAADAGRHPADHLISSLRARRFNTKQTAPSGDLGPAGRSGRK